MAFDLSAYPSIETALFVRIDVPDFEILRFSNFNRPYTIDGESYTALGTLLSISDSQSELRTTSGELSIVISGIPNTTIGNFLNQKIRGSAVEAYRVLFDTDSQVLAIANNPTGRFQGIVDNFSIEEQFDSASQVASSTVLITCNSTVDLLSNKTSGRRTNPIDQKALYPTDLSMDRVLKLSKANLNWGAPT